VIIAASVSAIILLLLVIVCAFAGKPCKDELDQIQK
jgi:hypothetical protein